MTKLFISIFLILVVAVPIVSSAATVDDLLAQILTLQAELADLQNNPASLTSAAVLSDIPATSTSTVHFTIVENGENLELIAATSTQN